IKSDNSVAAIPKVEPIPEPTPEPEPEPTPEPVPNPIQTEERPILKPIPKPEDAKVSTSLSDVLVKGAVIMAVSTQFKDLWISQKSDDSIAIEHMDGKICAFKIEDGQVLYLEGSFAEVAEDKKNAIESKLKEFRE
ncbi:MAG: hypothetical protein ACTSVZ_00250, partial [Promethearchaeota archaeon]